MDNTEEYTDESIRERILMENAQVPVTSTVTSACRSTCPAVESSVKSSSETSASRSKSAAEESSVKSSTLSSASGSESTAEKNSIESDKEHILRYVLPESKSKPATNHLDESQKASNSLKNEPVKENTKTSSVTCIEPTASTSSYTMDSSYLQSAISEGLSRYVSSELDNSQKSSNPCKNLSFTDYMNAFVIGLRSSASTTSKTIYINSLQSSTEDGFWHVLPENTEKESNSFKYGSVTENTKTSVTGIASSSSSTMDNGSLQSSTMANSFLQSSTMANSSLQSVQASSSSYTMDKSSLQSSTKDIFRYVLPEIKLPPDIKHLDNSKKEASNSLKNGSAAENTNAAVTSMATTASSSGYTMDDSSLQASTKDIYRYVSQLPSEIKHSINIKKASAFNSFKKKSATENTEAAVASMATTASSSGYIMENSSLQSGTQPTISQGILPKTFKPKIVQDNSVKNPYPIRTGSRIENTEVAGTSSGPFATCSKSKFLSSVYMLGADGKLSVIVMDNNGEPTSQIRFRSDGTPDEKAHPVNFTQFHKPGMAEAIGYAIEKTLWEVGNATTSYHLHIKESRKVGMNVNNLKKLTHDKLTRKSKKYRNKILLYGDRLKDYLQVSIDNLHKLDEDILKLVEVFQCINSDRALLERTLYTMQYAQLSFQEYAEAYNASRVMNLWLDRAQNFLMMGAARIDYSHTIENEMLSMFEDM